MIRRRLDEGAARRVGPTPALLVASVLSLALWPLQGCTPGGESAQTSALGGPRIAMVVYDAGETLALMPVADRLEEGGAEVEWYPLTPWAADLLTANGESFFPLPESVAAMPHTEDREGDSDTGYWETELARGPPMLVISGMVSAIQGKLGARLAEMDIPTRGIYDGFQPPTSSSIGFRMAGNFHEVWVPTERVRAGFAALGMETVVVGQPTLETWRRGSEEVDVAAVRETQGLGPEDRVLLFAGQYGDGYEELVDSFLRSIQETLEADSSLVLVMSHHPRTDGRVERLALERAEFGDGAPGQAGPPQAVMMSEGLNTMEMATASEVVLTWTSTVGTQAAFMGKQVVYYSPPEGFDTYLVDQGAALLADEITLGEVLAGALGDPKGAEEIRRTLLEAGYVVDADLVVAERVLGALAGGGT